MNSVTKQTQDRIVNAEPTKDFFITMLVKDIPLIRAIIDLVDNCLDGAQRIRGDKDYTELYVRIEATKEHFKISDNCGGIPVDIAKNYAFRFGRPKDMPEMKHSVGQFGVGMKRAIFKIGKKFKIKSTTATSYFTMEEDVEEWKKHNRWEFKFKELETSLTKTPTDNEQGTKIEVTSLHESIAEEFTRENFQNRLRVELETAHQASIERQINVVLNGVPLTFRPNEILSSEDLQSAFKKMEFAEVDEETVKVKIYTGIGDSYPPSAGWYVYCNGRCVLKADQTLTTGWGEGGEETIPKYHNTHARFRGYVFFDCDDAKRLPWNTTKTGVDVDSPLFRSVRQTMISMMRPIIDFDYKMAEEKNPEVESKPYTDMVEDAQKHNLIKIKPSDVFSVIDVRVSTVRRAEDSKRVIQYRKQNDEIEKAKKALNVSTLREVGEKTFEYFYEMECED